MTLVLVVVAVVYVGMTLGSLPGLKLDRASIALLGAIVLIAAGRISQKEAVAAIDIGTIVMLFGLMLVSAQLQMAGFYTAVTRWLAGVSIGPRGLLAVLILVAGLLSSMLTNDVTCIAMAPVLIEGCRERKLNPAPYLLALACAANCCSAATPMASPQNMLISEAMNLSFVRFLLDAGIPAFASLAVVWLVITIQYRGRWQLAPTAPVTLSVAPELYRSEAIKGIVIAASVVLIFVFTNWSRSTVALAAGGLLLVDRRFQSRQMLDRIDWELLVLIIGLFIVTGALNATHLPNHWLADLQHVGVDLRKPAWIFGVAAVLSDVVSNVPAVMLLLPLAQGTLSGAAMALASGLSSNLILIGSLANLIVIDAANREGIRISFSQHARTGVPVTLLTLAIAAGWLWLRSG